jgi:predicted Fe-Mo cluster-binding NifX family protein
MSNYIALSVDESGTKMWNGHFGMSPQFFIYDRQGNRVEVRENPHGFKRGEKHEHHDDPQRIVKLLADCKVFIARRMGEQSRRQLVRKMDIETVLTDETDPQAALKAYLAAGPGG